MLAKLKPLIPGIGLSTLFAVAAWFCVQSIRPWVVLEALLFGILLGVLWRNTAGISPQLRPGIEFCARNLLEFTVVLIGFKLSLGRLLSVGPQALIGVLLLVPLVIGVAMLVGRLTSIPLKLATLLGVGSAICGSSAIVAVAPAIKAREEDAVLAISGMNILGAAGVLFFAAVAHSVPLSDTQYGVWAGMSLQAVPTTLAAAFARSDLAGDVGTLVKMARVALLVPVSLILHWVFSRHGDGGTRARVPYYVIGFVLAAVVNSLGVIPATWVAPLKDITDWLMLVAMTALGLSVDLRAVRHKALPALIVGAALFALATLCGFLWASYGIPGAA